MILLYLLSLAVICLWKITPAGDSIHEDYLAIPQTTAIRGIMACLIFCSHLRSYLPFDDAAGQLYVRVLSTIGQYMVAPFFFYSGYGLVLSYRNKADYQRGFLRKRLGKTWFHFGVAVTLFYGLNLVLRIPCPFSRYLVSLTGWTDIGNSNWFMFDTFLLYLFMWAAMHMANRMGDADPAVRTRQLVLLMLLPTMALLWSLSRLRETWWYDTLLSFAFGGAYVLLKEPVDAFCRRSGSWLLLTLTAAGAMLLCRQSSGYVADNLGACLFVLLITLATMKFRIRNPILLWIGKHSFFIYIYMRIPMIFLHHFGLLTDLPSLFAAVSLILTLVLAWSMSRLHSKIDPCLFSRA